GDGDIKLFAIDGGEGAGRSHEQDFIHGLALGGMRGDGVAVSERPVVGREHSTVGQNDGAAGEAPDLDTLAVNELFAVVGLEQQPIAVGNLQLAGFAHIEGGGGAAGDEINLGSI